MRKLSVTEKKELSRLVRQGQINLGVPVRWLDKNPDMCEFTESASLERVLHLANLSVEEEEDIRTRYADILEEERKMEEGN